MDDRSDALDTAAQFARRYLDSLSERNVGPMADATAIGERLPSSRISVSNWSTTETDADRTVEAILRATRV